MGSADLLLQAPELGGIKKIGQGDPQPVAKHLDGDHPGIDAFPVQDILDGGRGNGGLGGQLVDGHTLLLAQAKQTVLDGGIGIHKTLLTSNFMDLL